MPKSPYSIGGMPIPRTTSITGILAKHGLPFWAAGCAVDYIDAYVLPGTQYGERALQAIFADAKTAHIKKRDDAAGFGTHIHEILERYVNACIDGSDKALFESSLWISTEEKQILDSFIELTKDWQWLASEEVVKHPRYRYGGKVDAVALLPSGKIAIIDFKTSNSIYQEAHIQVAMYAAAKPKAALKEVWADITEGYIIHLNKESLSWNELIPVDLEYHKKYIKHFCAVHSWAKDLKK